MPCLNDIILHQITKLDYTLAAPGLRGLNSATTRALQEILRRAIDELGVASAAAQGLNTTLTSCERLKEQPLQHLYLLKDSLGDGGRGEFAGLLKVARRHLYLYDGAGVVREVDPICVLDFYIVPRHQRRGYGKALFDYMLSDQNIRVHQLAIDAPSQMMEQFLHKNYNITQLQRQANNFAVTPNFFAALPTSSNSSRAPSPFGRAPSPFQQSTPAGGRYGAPRPQDQVAAIIHGNDYLVPFDHRLERYQSEGSLSLAGSTSPSPPPRPLSLSSSEGEYERPRSVSPNRGINRGNTPTPPPAYAAPVPLQRTNPGPAHQGRKRARSWSPASPVAYSTEIMWTTPENSGASGSRPTPPESSPIVVDLTSPDGDEAAARTPPAPATPTGTPPAGMPSRKSPRRVSSLNARGYMDFKYYHHKLN